MTFKLQSAVGAPGAGERKVLRGVYKMSVGDQATAIFPSQASPFEFECAYIFDFGWGILTLHVARIHVPG